MVGVEIPPFLDISAFIPQLGSLLCYCFSGSMDTIADYCAVRLVL